MSNPFPQECILHNQAELEDFAWEIKESAGQFSLMLARCNYANLRQQLVESLRQQCALEIRVLSLKSSETALYTRILAEVGEDPPGAMMVFGLEMVTDLEQLLSTANQVREEFRKNCPFSVVLWVTDDVWRVLVHAAPDLESWATRTHFTSPPEALNQGLQQAVDRLFSALLNPETIETFDTLRPNLDLGFFNPSELASAIQELRIHGQELDPILQASLDFVEGLRTERPAEALECFERSLQFWQQQESQEAEAASSASNTDNPTLREGFLLFYIGRVQYEIAASAPQTPDWEQVRQSLQQAIERFEQANRPDLVALCVPQLQRMLQKLRAWDELDAVATKGLELHRIYGTQTRLSQDYGFLAKVALERQHWTAAQQAAQQALTELAKEPEDRLWLRGLYLLFLAQAEGKLGNSETAIAHLTEADARAVSDRGYPKFAIQILKELRELYFERKQYLEAFQTKQERLSIEQQYGIRAFVGAGRLQPRRQEVVTEFQAPTAEMVAPEIVAAGRQPDLARLIEQIGRLDYLLIVLHGNSGVGKSSLVNAGLVPTLKQRAIGVRDNVPVVMRVYTQWVQELDRLLNEEQGDRRVQEQGDNQADTQHPTPNSLLEQLRQLEQRNLRTVLIFDQFEEFFFLYQKPEERKPFFEFLAQSFQILSLKVVLSLREDYLHYLLELNRLPSWVQRGIDILSRNVLYELGNFSCNDARTIIQSLTERARFYLEPALVEQLVADLAQDLGTVRPIELQVVGEQLQSEQPPITTLAQYHSLGDNPKEELVKRYLDGVVADCGAENKQLAELVLYLLTDEKGFRPIKTRDELAADLAADKDKLNLVLDIFVASGLVSLLPEVPDDRYQLVHDYLVGFIRQQQGAEIAEELKLTKLQLKQALHRAKIAEIEALNSSAEILWISRNQLGALVASVKAGRKLLDTDASTTIKLKATNKLRQVLCGMQERNRLEGHDDAVTSISFSPDSNMIATASEDSTAKLWSYNGKELQTLQGHDAPVNKVSFNPDGKVIATASSDGTVKLWNRDGKELQTLQGHNKQVNSVTFSPDGKVIATASEDGTVKLWSCDGKELFQTLYGHDITPVSKVSFSPNGKMLVTASEDGIVKLWSYDGKELQTLQGRDTPITSINFSPDGNTIIAASGDNIVKHWSLNGEEINLLDLFNKQKFNVIFSPNGSTVAIASKDGSVKLRSLDKEDKEDILLLKEQNFRVKNISFSLDSQLVAIASEDGTIKLYSCDGGEISTLTGHTKKVNSISFSPDGNKIATASNDQTVRLWKLDGEEIRTFHRHQDKVRSVSFSPDGNTIVSGSDDKTAKLWSCDGQELKTFYGHTKEINSVSFSPDSKTVATASKDCTVKIWSLDGKELHTLYGYGDAIKSVSFSPDSKRIATSSSGKTVKLWNHDGRELQTLKGHKKQIRSVSFSPDGNRIATASNDNTVILWNCDGSELKTIEGHKAPINSVSFSPDGNIIATASEDGTVKLWSLDGKGKELQTLYGHEAQVTSVSFSPDGTIIATASNDTTAKLWSLVRNKLNVSSTNNNHLDGDILNSDRDTISTDSGNETPKLRSLDEYQLQSLVRHNATVRSVTFSPNGNNLVTASIDKTIKLWDLNGQKLKTFQGHDKQVRSASFSPDGNMIVTASSDMTAKLWNLNGEEIKTFLGHSATVRNACFSPDGNMIATASSDKTVKLWSLNGQELRTLQGHSTTVTSVSFSPNGNMIATASSDKTVKLWSLEGRELQTLQGHSTTVRSVCFSPDGNTIATASSDKTVKLWSPDGTILQTLYGHSNQIRSVTFSPDGKTIATASEDGTVKLWSCDGKELQTLYGHNSAVYSISFSPNQPILASSDSNGRVILWGLESLALEKLRDLELPELLQCGFDWLRDYLNNNPNVEQGDRNLCRDWYLQ